MAKNTEDTESTNASPDRLVSALPLAAAFLMDAAVGMGGVFLFYYARDELHASSAAIGLLTLGTGGAFLLGTILLGPLGDRFGRRRFVVLTTVVMAALSLAAPHIRSVLLLQVLFPVAVFTQGAFWPMLEAGVADSARTGGLSRRFMGFNLAWTAGFALGAMGGGCLYAAGPRLAFYAAAGLTLAGGVLAFVFHGKRQRTPPSPPDENGHERLPEPKVRRAFLLAALVLNLGAMAVNVSWRNYTEYAAKDLDVSAAWAGCFPGVMFAGMFVVFPLMGGRWWHYRRWPLVAGALLPLAGALLGSIGGWTGETRMSGYAVMIAASALVGLGCGMTYAATLYYAMHAPGRRAGMGSIHESVIGAGAVAACLGGFLKDTRLPELLPVVPNRMPFLTAAALALVTCAVGTGLLVALTRRGRAPAGSGITPAGPG